MVCMHYACIYRNAANWFPDMQKRDMFLYKHNIFLRKKIQVLSLRASKPLMNQQRSMYSTLQR